MEKHPVVANGGRQWPAESTPAVARRVEPAGKPLGGDNDGAGRQAGRAFGASTLGEAVTAGRNRRYTGGHGTVQFGGGRKRGLQIRESRIPPPSPVGLEVELNRQSPKRFGAGVVPGGDGSVARRVGRDDHHGRNAQPAAGQAATKDFVLLYFGVVRPYKGVEDLVAALGLLPPKIRNRCRLVLVGEKWEGWTAPEQAIAASPNADRIQFTDRYVTDAEVADHFAHADAVVFPYRRSSSSGPLHIAMSSGLPVIVTAVGGLVEAADKYEGTRFVPPADPPALAAAMAKLTDHPATRFPDPHSWSTTAQAYGHLGC